MAVKGLELFRDYFRGGQDKYVLIGGAACYLVMDDAGLGFRATKDLDIVLCVEAIDAAFASKQTPPEAIILRRLFICPAYPVRSNRFR